MSRVYIAKGRLARTPYHIDKIERNIYSMEELCYILVQSAQFLDADIMDPELVRWIGTELELPLLAKKLSKYLGKPRSLSDFVSCILDETGFIPPDKQVRTRQIVSAGGGMQGFEKRASQAAIMAENGQIWQALASYEQILADLPETERSMRTDIWCRIGRIYAFLFRFRKAADAYESAYKLTHDPAIYLQYLSAVRLSLGSKEYVSYISEHPEAYEASLELEKKVKEAEMNFQDSGRKSEIDQLLRYRNQGQDTNYEIALQQIIQQMKDDYRRTKQVAF